MADETREKNEQLAQTLFNKGFAAFERGNLDIAIELLLRCVELSPGFSRARRFLRAAEMQKAKKSPPSALGGRLGDLTSLPAHVKVAALLKAGRADRALVAAEKLLQRNPLSLKSAYLVAQAAEEAGQPAAAVITLEALIETAPEDLELAKQLGIAYMKSEDYAKARDCFVRVSNANPADSEVLRLLKDSEAQNSMKAGGWEEAAGQKDGYRKLIRDEEQAKKLDIQAKAQATVSDAEALIADARAKMAAEPNNINYYRALARLLQQQKRFPEAIEVLEQARSLGSSDPELDRTLTSARVQDFAARIGALRGKGDEAGAAKLEAERDQFVFDDLVARVQRFPNDLRLRYELGVLYCQNEYYDEAIQQLQLAQRSPKERNDALYFLAACFRAKGQNDMALMQLETALEQLPIMDESRKKVLFDLGELYEAAGESEKAFNCYREVYGADIAYRDIGQKMERIYKLRQQKA